MRFPVIPAVLLASLATATPQAAPSEAAEAVVAPVTKAVWNGYRRFNSTCNHCHGFDGAGSSFGPSLVEAPLDPKAFRSAVIAGKRSGTSVMKGFGDDPNVVDHIDDIYAYLAARAEGRVGRGRPRHPE